MKNKPFWYVAFERQQLTERQMLALKQDDLVVGTRPPQPDQLLKLLAHTNKEKKHLWLQ
jgi:hypothetical protein